MGGAVLILGLAIFGAGVAMPYVAFTSAYRTSIVSAVYSEIEACRKDAKTLVPANAVDIVIQGMTAQLAPRPLQALLVKAGLLGK